MLACVRACLRTAGLVLLAATIGACAGRRDADGAGPGWEDTDGYYEVPRSNITYVVASLKSVELVRAGKPLPKVVRAFGARGEPVVFEADDAGLEQRLMAEYRKRCGLTR